MSQLATRSIQRYRSWRPVELPSYLTKIGFPAWLLACAAVSWRWLLGPGWVSYVLSLACVVGYTIYGVLFLSKNWRSKRMWLWLAAIIILAFVASLLARMILG